MSGTPGLGAFNKDKVANKFGIQLKPKDASQRSLTENKSTTTAITGTSNVAKNKTISDFRTDNNTNGFLFNTNRTTSSKTPESSRKSATNKSTSQLVNTSVNTNQRSNNLTSNDNHSTTKSKESLSSKSPATTKRSNVIPTERAVSPAPPIKRPSVSTNSPKTKTEAQIERQKDQPLYRRQLSKPLDNTSPTTTTTTTTPPSSTTSLKR